MAIFWKNNEDEIESGYFWDVPASNPLVRLWVIDAPTPESTWIGKVFERQTEEKKDTWIWTKIKESFVWWIERIWDAWVGLANDKFTIPEAFMRGWAWALQSFFSPVSWLIWEGVEEGILALSDDFKKNVTDDVAPTIQSVVKWYQWQEPEQQRRLNNIWVWLEVLIEFVWWGAIKKPLEEIAWSVITWAKNIPSDGIELLKEWATNIKDKVSGIELPSFKKEIDEIPDEMITVKGNIDWVDVEVPQVNRTLSEKTVWLISPDIKNSTLAWKAVSPRTIWKNRKAKLASVRDVEARVKNFYKNIRTGVLDGDISTLQDSAQTMVNNLDSVWARIGNAVQKVDWNISIDNTLTDSMSQALFTKWSEVSPATPILKKFFDSLWDGNLTISEAYKLKKAYSNEVSKLVRAWDAGTDQYKALADWVNFLNTKIDEIIETKLWTEFATDKKLYRDLLLLADDMVASSLVEGRRSANTFAERIGMLESLTSPIAATKRKLIQAAEDPNTRGWAWIELIKRYDEAAVKNLSSPDIKSQLSKVDIKTPDGINKATNTIISTLDIAKDKLSEVTIIIKEFIAKHWEGFKDKLSDLMDDIADKVWARSKFIDDSGFKDMWTSSKVDDFGVKLTDLGDPRDIAIKLINWELEWKQVLFHWSNHASDIANNWFNLSKQSWNALWQWKTFHFNDPIRARKFWKDTVVTVLPDDAKILKLDNPRYNELFDNQGKMKKEGFIGKETDNSQYWGSEIQIFNNDVLNNRALRINTSAWVDFNTKKIEDFSNIK